MSTLITGSEGFVGQHLIKSLPVSSFPIFGTFVADTDRAEQDQLFYSQIDITDAEALDRFVREVKPERAFHLAAFSHVGGSFKNPDLVRQVNVEGTRILLASLRKYAPAARILLVSSAEVHGSAAPSEGDRYAESDACRPLSPYAESKLEMEALGMECHQKHGQDIRIVRPYHHTGPGQSETFIFSYIAKTIAEIRKGDRPSKVELGNIDLMRDFTDVRDVVGAYNLVLEKGRSGEIYNVCTGRGVMLRELIEKMISLSELKIDIVIDDKRKRSSDIGMMIGNPEKLEQETQWRPGIPLEKTLKDMLDYWKQRIIK